MTLISNLLCLAPALVLVALLLLRRYPGERLLVATRKRAREHHHARPRAYRPPHPRPFLMAPRGGLLMAFALAVRPPPALRAS